MRVAFYVARFDCDHIQTPPSLQYLAGYLVGTVCVKSEDIIFADTPEQVIEFKPQILGVGSVSQCINDAKSFARAVRSKLPDCWNVLGGYHVSALPDLLPECFDIGVIGEGEITLAEIVSLRGEKTRLESSYLESILGICFRDEKGEIRKTQRRPLIKDIDALPTPLRRMPYGQEWPYLFTARGCPYECTYCASQTFWDRYRAHSAKYVVDEISRLVYGFGVTSIYFVDDLFIAPISRLRQIRQLMEEKGLLGQLSFKGFVRINLVDEEVMRILKELGFVEIRFGMETASERLQKLIKHQPFTNAQVEKVIMLANKYEIPICASFMFGIPGEETCDIDATRGFLRKFKGKSGISGFYMTQPVPGAKLWDECIAKGLIHKELDFSTLELDMTRKDFNWDRVLYLNADKIPLLRFKELMNEIRAEFVTRPQPQPSKMEVDSLHRDELTFSKKTLAACKKIIAACLCRLGYEIRHIRIEQPATSPNMTLEKKHGLKLYVGCGEDTKEGFVGCDIRSLPSVSIICNAWEVSRYCEDVKEIYARHMLEHLTLPQVEMTLKDWFESLVMAGKLHIVVPNVDAHIEQWKKAVWNEETWGQKFSDARYSFAGFWGWQRELAGGELALSGADLWDVHKSGFNKEFLSFLLRRTGFSEIECKVVDNVHLVARAIKKMELGERQIAPHLDGIRADHRGRYELATRYVPIGAKVLDIACGVGYGSYIMSEKSQCDYILSVDLSAEAIGFAKSHYQTPKIEYRIGECLTIDLERENYDIVVSFETIEHLPEDVAFLKKMNNALKPDGILICSTPNQDKMPYDKKEFPFHIRHYTPAELNELLTEAGFIVEQRWSQHNNQLTDVIEGWEGVFNIAVCRKIRT